MRAAQASDWNNTPLPTQRARLDVTGTYTPAEMAHIRRGLVPEQMEDKWFIYWADDRLHLHRSWTGFCVYVAEFGQRDGTDVLLGADVNRNPEEYGSTDDRYDAALLLYLIDVLLLHLDTEMPRLTDSDMQHTAATWSQVGRAMLGEHPELVEDGEDLDDLEDLEDPEDPDAADS